MNILTWLFAGGLMGWATSLYMTSTQPSSVAFNIGVGVVGAALGDWLLGPTVGVAPGFSALGVIVSALGSALLLVAAHFVQRRRAS